MTAPGAVRYRFPPELRELGRRHAVVEASAGTGKTYLLEHLVVDLLLRREMSLEQILVVTFTEKATAELADRVRRKLQELRDLRADHPNTVGASDEDCWLVDERARRKLESNLHAFDRASISTIHAFCQRLLGEHAFFNRRLFAEEIVDEEDAFKVAFADALRRDVVDNPALANLVATWMGVGYGLERLQRAVLRALRGLSCLHPPRPEAQRPGLVDDVAVLAAARRLAVADPARVKEALARRKVHPSTAKSVVSKVTELREAAAACQEPRDVPVLLALVDVIDKNRDGALEFVRGHLDKNASDPDLAPIAQAFAAFHQQAVPLIGAAVGRLTPLVAARLESHKREAGLFDFQDMLTLTARSLEGEGAGARALIASVRERYRHALIDEFQDTDEVQWSIFRRIFFDSPAGHVLTVIGDPKQAIYSFRGADVHTYLQARRAIEAAGGPRLHLQENFRSTAPIIDAYNALLDQAAPFFRPQGGILYDHPVRCGRPQADAETPAVVVFDLETQAKELLTWQVKRSLLARIATEIARLVRPDGAEGQGAPGRAGDIFVLCRTIRECREVGDALRAVNVPHAFYKQEKLFSTIEAREVLDLLRAIADPDDVTARGRAFITPFFGLSLTDLAACDDLDGSHALLRLLYDWRALAEAGDFETLFARVVDDSGIVCREVFWNPGERSLTNYLHLLELLQEEAAHTRATIRELAQTLGAYIRGTRRPPGDARDLQRLETDADAVQIMTIHHAKGLEAGVVFLYGGFWPGPPSDVRVFHDEEDRRVVRVGRLPASEKDRYEDEQDDEERRVLYVALTRARRKLYLPHFPPAFRQLRGCYRFINQRLDELWQGFTLPEVRALFQRVPVRCPEEALPPPVAPAPAAVAAWRLPPDLLAPERASERAGFGPLATGRAGFLVTSYSAVKRLHPGARPAAPGDEANDATADEAGRADEAAADLPEHELPRGRLTGRFLHEVIEELPLETLAGEPPPTVATWAALPDVEALFERKRQRHDRSPAHLPHGRDLVHAALTSPLALGGVTVPRLAGVGRALREVEFFYPIPERAHPLLAAEAAGERAAHEGRPFRIERGVVKGYIDLLFEHEGRTYVCDWKGDWLPTWDPARLAAHCDQHYAIQVELYTLATLRLMGVETLEAFEARFGGVVFCFLRGMVGRRDGVAEGVHFQRPSWEEVLAWQRKMLASGFWGLS